jgi:threonyl-tRNA synthetase
MVVERLQKEVPNLRIDRDLESTTVSDKVRNAELLKIPYIIVIGDKEEENKNRFDEDFQKYQIELK